MQTPSSGCNGCATACRFNSDSAGDFKLIRRRVIYQHLRILKTNAQWRLQKLI
jgi:hypothetical protein